MTKFNKHLEGLENGFLLSTLRIQPPLIIEKYEIDEALKILKSAIIQYEFNEINDSELKNIVGW
ncbi:hypothetical protein [Fusibacter sp. 3D3]|uniref:hypothetical protein n=1 Tax=Fusibacter sp. 3D3 TaxID=1048380 RepID=UPI001586A3F8|nr:hypothetical protein [Fusibacter sp. 3D3]